MVKREYLFFNKFNLHLLFKISIFCASLCLWDLVVKFLINQTDQQSELKLCTMRELL